MKVAILNHDHTIKTALGSVVCHTNRVCPTNRKRNRPQLCVVLLDMLAQGVSLYGVASVSRIEKKLQVSFAKEPYKRDVILQKRPII